MRNWRLDLCRTPGPHLVSGGVCDLSLCLFHFPCPRTLDRLTDLWSGQYAACANHELDARVHSDICQRRRAICGFRIARQSGYGQSTKCRCQSRDLPLGLRATADLSDHEYEKRIVRHERVYHAAEQRANRDRKSAAGHQLRRSLDRVLIECNVVDAVDAEQHESWRF
jgi:hypothetical protein